MRILHTSDWHIGRTLYGKKRYDEFEKFFDWLAGVIEEKRVDILLVAGDVFDTTMPGNQAQELYYRFLCRAAASCCRHVVITGGNHDSPAFLNAPKEILRVLNVHVIGSITGDCNDEVLLLKDGKGSPELIVCAVPYLRDRDIRIVEAGENPEDKERKMSEGIAAHYSRVCELAEERRRDTGVPVFVMGHLFTRGGQIMEGDGVRELYIGSLAHVNPHIFPETADYCALGHLHIPQTVEGSPFRRYSGSPIPMGFGEAGQKKSLCLVERAGTEVDVELVEVPTFQRLERIEGGWDDITGALRNLECPASKVWLEVIYNGEERGSLREQLDEMASVQGAEILVVRNQRIIDGVLSAADGCETLEDLTEDQVFLRCLNERAIKEERRADLWRLYREAYESLKERDVRDEKGGRP